MKLSLSNLGIFAFHRMVAFVVDSARHDAKEKERSRRGPVAIFTENPHDPNITQFQFLKPCKIPSNVVNTAGPIPQNWLKCSTNIWLSHPLTLRSV